MIIRKPNGILCILDVYSEGGDKQEKGFPYILFRQIKDNKFNNLDQSLTMTPIKGEEDNEGIYSYLLDFGESKFDELLIFYYFKKDNEIKRIIEHISFKDYGVIEQQTSGDVAVNKNKVGITVPFIKHA